MEKNSNHSPFHIRYVTNRLWQKEIPKKDQRSYRDKDNDDSLMTYEEFSNMVNILKRELPLENNGSSYLHSSGVQLSYKISNDDEILDVRAPRIRYLLEFGKKVSIKII